MQRSDRKDGDYRYLTEKQYQALEKQQSPEVIKSGIKEVDACYQAAKKCIDSYQLEKAVPQLIEAIKLLGRPTSPELIKILFKMNCLLANAYYETRHYRAAVDLYVQVFKDPLFEGQQEAERTHYFQLYRAAILGRVYLNLRLKNDEAYNREFELFTDYLKTLPPSIKFFNEGVNIFKWAFRRFDPATKIPGLYPVKYKKRLQINIEIDELHDELISIEDELNEIEICLDKEELEKKESKKISEAFSKIEDSFFYSNICLGRLKDTAPEPMQSEARKCFDHLKQRSVKTQKKYVDKQSQASAGFKKKQATALDTLHHHFKTTSQPERKEQRSLFITTQFQEMGLSSRPSVSTSSITSSLSSNLSDVLTPKSKPSYVLPSPIEYPSGFSEDKTSPVSTGLCSIETPDDGSGDLFYSTINLEFSSLDTNLEKWITENIFDQKKGEKWDISSFQTPYHLTILNFGVGLYELSKDPDQLEEFKKAIEIIFSARQMTPLQIDKLMKFKTVKNYLVIEFKFNPELKAIREALIELSKNYSIGLYSVIEDYKFHITIAKSNFPISQQWIDALNKRFIIEFLGLELPYDRAVLVRRFGHQFSSRTEHLLKLSWSPSEKIFCLPVAPKSTMAYVSGPPVLSVPVVPVMPVIIMPFPVLLPYAQSPYLLLGGQRPMRTPEQSGPAILLYNPGHYYK